MTECPYCGDPLTEPLEDHVLECAPARGQMYGDMEYGDRD